MVSEEKKKRKTTAVVLIVGRDPNFKARCTCSPCFPSWILRLWEGLCLDLQRYASGIHVGKGVVIYLLCVNSETAAGKSPSEFMRQLRELRELQPIEHDKTRLLIRGLGTILPNSSHFTDAASQAGFVNVGYLERIHSALPQANLLEGAGI